MSFNRYTSVVYLIANLICTSTLFGAVRDYDPATKTPFIFEHNTVRSNPAYFSGGQPFFYVQPWYADPASGGNAGVLVPLNHLQIGGQTEWQTQKLGSDSASQGTPATANVTVSKTLYPFLRIGLNQLVVSDLSNNTTYTGNGAGFYYSYGQPKNGWSMHDLEIGTSYLFRTLWQGKAQFLPQHGLFFHLTSAVWRSSVLALGFDFKFHPALDKEDYWSGNGIYFDIYDFRLAGGVGIDNAQNIDYNSGLEFAWSGGSYQSKISYGFQHFYDKQSLHSLSYTHTFLAANPDKPEIKIAVSLTNAATSGRLDGDQFGTQPVIFNFENSNDFIMTGWYIRIKRVDGEAVALIRSNNRAFLEDYKFSWRGLTETLTGAQQYSIRKLPEVVLWDGWTEASRPAVAGIYQAELTVLKHEKSHRFLSKPFTIATGTQPGEIKLTTRRFWNATLKQYQENLESATLPSTNYFLYNRFGKQQLKPDKDTLTIPPGIGQLTVVATSPGRNVFENTISKSETKNRIQTNQLIFKHGAKICFQSESDLSKKHWSLIVKDDNHDLVFMHTGYGDWARHSKTDTQKRICLAKKLKSGQYQYALLVADKPIVDTVKETAIAEAEWFSFWSDSQAPTVEVEWLQDSFSPDLDHRQDFARFRLKAVDDFWIKRFKLTIWEHLGPRQKRIFDKIEGLTKLNETQYIFSGKDKQGYVPANGSEFELVLEAEDWLGQTSTTRSGRLKTDLLLQPYQNGYYVDLPGFDDFKRKTHKQWLKYVCSNLGTYHNFRFEVQVHYSEIGDETGNLDRSENNARFLMEKLIDSGFNDLRFSYRGYGETLPAVPTGLYLPVYKSYRDNRVRLFLYPQAETKPKTDTPLFPSELLKDGQKK